MRKNVTGYNSQLSYKAGKLSAFALEGSEGGLPLGWFM